MDCAGAPHAQAGADEDIEARVQAMSVKELKTFIINNGDRIEGITEKSELRDLAKRILNEKHQLASASTDVGEEVEATSPADAFCKILSKTPSAQVSALLNERIAALSGGLTFQDIPPVASKVCGKVFQSGDLAYNCKTCESDSTCVQCQVCFENSNHDGHDVFFHRAGVGGCCDCGDLEAWAAEGCCSKHGPNAVMSTEDPLMALPPSLLQATTTVFRGAVQYLATLAHEEVLSFHRCLRSVRESTSEINGEFYVLMHNDDVHTYEEVREVLSDRLMAHVPDADAATETIDKLGRCSVHRALSLNKAQMAVEHFRASGLLLSIAAPSLLEREKGAIALAHWLKKSCDASPVLARILIQELLWVDTSNIQRMIMEWLSDRFPKSFPTADESFLESLSVNSTTILDSVLRVHFFLPKLLIKQLADLFMRCIMDDLFKKELGLAMGNAMRLLSRMYANGIGCKAYDLLDIDVQLFTVKSIAIEFNNRFHKQLAETLVDACGDFLKVASDDDGDIDLEHHSLHHGRFAIFFSSLRWQCQLDIFDDIQGIARPFKRLIDQVLVKCTNLRPIARNQRAEHVIFEDDTFQEAFNLEIGTWVTVESVIDALQGLERNRFDVVEVFRYAVEKCTQASSRESSVYLGTRSFSFHLPLYRFTSLLGRMLTYESKASSTSTTTEDFFGSLIGQPLASADAPLATIVACTQILLGMWRRDGLNVAGQMRFYMFDRRFNYFDLDMFSVQMAWVSIVAQEGNDRGMRIFLEWLLKAFEIEAWFFRRSTVAPFEQKVEILDEIFRFIAVMVSAVPADPRTAMKNQIRRAIVQRLAMAPSGGLELNAINESLDDERLIKMEEQSSSHRFTEEEVEEIVLECCKTVDNQDGQTRYELKQSLWLDEFDPCYWHSSRTEIERALEQRDKELRRVPLDRAVPLVPPAPRPAVQYLPLLRGLCSDAFLLDVVREVLRDSVLSKDIIMDQPIMILSPPEGVIPVQLSKSDFDISTSRSSPGTLRGALNLLTMAMHNSELIDANVFTKRGEKLHQLSIVECIIALRSVSTAQDAEGHGLAWILNAVSAKFPETLPIMTSLLEGAKQLASDREATNGLTSTRSSSHGGMGNKRQSRKRASDAQQMMMERMRRAQQAAVKSLMGEEQESMESAQSSSPSNKAQTDGDGDEALQSEDLDQDGICSLCRDRGDVSKLGFFAFSHSSTWDRSAARGKPNILGHEGPPLGWVKAPSRGELGSVIGPVPTAANTNSGTLDWSMQDVDELTAGVATAGVQGSFNESDDDESDEEDDGDDDDGDFDVEMMIEEALQMGGAQELQDGLPGGDEVLLGMMAEATDQAAGARELAQTAAASMGSSMNCSDLYILEGGHGPAPGKLHIKCCPHMVHLECFQEYQRTAQGGISLEGSRMGEFQCSMCRAPSRLIVLMDQSRHSSLHVAGTSWEIDFPLLATIPYKQEENIYDEQVVQKLFKGRKEGGVAALQAIAFTLSVQFDSSQRSAKSLGDMLADQLKYRKESLAIISLMAKGALGTMSKLTYGGSEHWLDFLVKGYSNPSDFARILTARSRMSVTRETMNGEVKQPPATPHTTTCETEFHVPLFGTMGLVDRTNHLLLSVEDQMLLETVEGTSVNGLRIDQLRAIEGHLAHKIKATARRGFVPRGSTLLDVEPFELFCSVIGLNWGSLSSAFVSNALRLTVALGLSRCMRQPAKRGSPLAREAASLLETALVRKGLTLKNPMDAAEMEREMTALLLLLVNACAVINGPLWVKAMFPQGKSESVVNDGRLMWTTLGLPSPAPFLKASETVESTESLEALVNLVAPWFNNTEAAELEPSPYRSLVPAQVGMHFVDLPQRYETLYSLVMTRAVCPTRNVSPPKEAALCLLCGEVVCAGALCCSRRAGVGDILIGMGPATAHVQACGGGETSVGLFLLVERAQCLLMFGGRTISVPAPYVDMHGNPDPFLRKGRPLTLNQEKYEALQVQVADHRMAAHVVRTRNSASEHIILNHY